MTPTPNVRWQFRHTVLIFAPLLTVYASLTATGQAQSLGHGEWVVAAYLGGAHTNSAVVTLSQPSLGNRLRFDKVRFSGQSFTGPLYYGLRVGHFFRGLPFFGLEGEFIHLKVFSETQQPVNATGTRAGLPIERRIVLGEIVNRYSISHGLNLVLLNAMARYRPADRLYLVGRLGAGPTIPHTESDIDRHPQEQYEGGRMAVQLSAGVEARLWHGLYAVTEYKFTRTRQHGKIFQGTAEAVFKSHHGIFGLSFHF